MPSLPTCQDLAPDAVQTLMGPWPCMCMLGGLMGPDSGSPGGDDGLLLEGQMPALCLPTPSACCQGIIAP